MVALNVNLVIWDRTAANVHLITTDLPMELANVSENLLKHYYYVQCYLFLMLVVDKSMQLLVQTTLPAVRMECVPVKLDLEDLIVAGVWKMSLDVQKLLVSVKQDLLEMVVVWVSFMHET